jgi:hypothetical protein
MTVSLEEFGKKAGEYALNEFEYKGFTIKQWADKITSGEYQPVEWVSVKDRLPELFENVLTYDCDGKIFINWLEEITEMKSYFAYGSKTVTHWMPLPEPPKEGSDVND